MKLKLKNVGKIKEADIELSGLTLIAGPNDSGKSTVGKVLFALMKSIANYPALFEQIQRDKLYKEYLNPLHLELRTIERDELMQSQQVPLFIEAKISPQSKRKLLRVIHDLYRARDNILNNEEISDLLDVVRKNINGFRNKEYIEYLVSDAMKFLNKDKTSKDKIQLISNRIFQDVFENNINNSLYRKDVANIIFETDGVQVLSLISNNDSISCTSFNEGMTVFSDATLIENPFLLENNFSIYSDYRDRFVPVVMRPVDSKIIDTSTDLVEKERSAAKKLHKETYHEDLLKEFEEVFHSAQFKYSSSDGRLKYKVDSKAKELEISNIASGCKSFGLLYILLKTGVITKNGILILDEPENHLHPEWQIKYAEIICKMVKKGFYVLLTSHSPYMIQALRTYSEKEEIFDKKVNFYFASKDKNGKNYSIIENVRNEDGIFNDSRIFQSLYSPIEILDDIYSEINHKCKG